MAYANGLARTVSSEIGPLSRVLPLQVSRTRQIICGVSTKRQRQREEKRSTAQLKSEGALKPNQPTIASVLKLDVNKPREQNIANCFISRFDKQHFQRMLVELIVSSNQSFSFTENPILREIFDYLSPSVSIQRANLSARAVRYKIIQEYNRHKQKVIEVLRNSPGLLHISFDGWTSRNKLALYGIACFFRDEKDRLCKIMIGVPEAHRHFGSTIGGEVLDVLHTLGVGPEKIGYFTLDNAENNDTAMEVIGAELGFDGRLRRGRCIGHTLNLSAKALLFGKNADAFEQQLSGAEALSDTEYAQWRKKGPVGRLHNIVVDVRISHRLIYLFKEVQRVSGFTKSYSSHTDLAHLIVGSLNRPPSSHSLLVGKSKCIRICKCILSKIACSRIKYLYTTITMKSDLN